MDGITPVKQLMLAQIPSEHIRTSPNLIEKERTISLSAVSGLAVITGWQGLHGFQQDKGLKGGLSALHFAVSKHQVPSA